MAGIDEQALRLGDVEIDQAAGELRRDGAAIDVEPQVFSLIAYLAARPGALVSRDELIEAVWGGRIVSDSAIASRINAARAALGDDGKAQRIIRTVPRRGFRFVAPADEELPARPSLPDKPSIAVLPFENMSGDPEQEFFSDGITDDIITELGRYDELFVIARNSSFAYKGQRDDVRRIARELGVRYLLEGGVRRSSGRVRVTAQLVDALSGKHLWAERYDRQLEDIFAVQDEITAVIVNTLVPTLTHQHLLWRSEQDAASLNAYDHQLRAMDMFWKLTRLSTAATREEAQKAISLDEGLARSHALVAWTHLFEGANRWGGIVQLDAFRSGHAAATTSVAIDDREPWGHAALGFVNLYGFHAHDRAVTCLRRSVELNPNSSYFRGWYSMGLNYAGRPVDALKEIELAIRLNPHHPPIYLLFLGRVLFTLGRYDEALPHLTRLVYAMPDYSAGLSLVAACMAALDRHDEARGVVRQILESEPSFDLSAIAHSAPYRDPTTYEAYRNLLRDSGMPE